MSRPVATMTPEEREVQRAKQREYNRTYREKLKDDPARLERIMQNQRDGAIAYYNEHKSDPEYVKKINESNLKAYYKNVRPSAERMAERREKVKGYQRKRREKFNVKKIELQAYLGGKCVKCGITDTRLLDFDHIDPVKKTMVISQELHRPIEELQEELKNCQLMCPNCHRLKTLETNGNDSYKLRTFRNKYHQPFKPVADTDIVREDNRIHAPESEAKLIDLLADRTADVGV